MKYKAEIIKKFIENNQVRLVVKFAKGVAVLEQEFTINSPQELKNELRRRIARLEELDAFAAEPLGEIDLSEVAAVPDSVPTPMQLKEMEYERKLDLLKERKDLVHLGILKDADLGSLISEVTQLAKDLRKI